MPYSLQLALAAALVMLAVTPAVMALARRVGALDHPGPRRIHREPVPTLGGLALVVAVLAPAWLARALPGPAHLLDGGPLLGLTLAALPLVVLGVWDDLRGAHWGAKIAAQVVAALVLARFGFGVHALTNPFGPPLDLGPFNLLLTVAWVVVVANAINLIDGLDGLASGVVLLASAALWFAAREHGDFYVMFIASLLIGATAGFLRFNFPPARVFMGDTGSQFLGLVLAAVALLENRKGTAAVTLLLPLVAMGVPIADSVGAFVRRARRGQPVFRADSSHVHHLLLRLGLSQRRVLLVLWGFSALLGAVAVGLSHLPRPAAVVVAVALALALMGAYEWLERRARRGDE